MTGRALLYGATGYSGRLVARRLAAAGVDVVLAGRNAARVRALAETLGLPWMAFELGTTAAVASRIAGFAVVLHAAVSSNGPAAPMLAACLAERVHYLDLSGEWPAFVDAMAADSDARAAGTMVMPGVGLTIAATDCLLALAMAAQPDAVALRLGVSRAEVVTAGTVASAARLFSPDVLVRRQGRVMTVPAGTLTHAFDFGDGLREATALSWADIATAGFTTGVDDVTVYSQLDWGQRTAFRAGGLAMALTGPAPWRELGEAMADAWTDAPDDASRQRAGFVMVVEALDPWRRVRRLRLLTRDGYTVSEYTASAAVRHVLDGTWTAGFQTPSRVFGADFILRLGCAELDPGPAYMGAAACTPRE
jgi:short subunit dehydrogenase-like uncharacterized protein